MFAVIHTLYECECNNDKEVSYMYICYIYWHIYNSETIS